MFAVRRRDDETILVIGQVVGNLTATERIEIQATGIVQGDIKAPRLSVQEGATLNGSIEMGSAGSTRCRMGSSDRVAHSPARTATAQTHMGAAPCMDALPTSTE